MITPSGAFAGAVAKWLSQWLSTWCAASLLADRAFRAGTEAYGLAGNAGSFLFARAPVGLIGFGDLGQQLRRLLVPFRNPVEGLRPLAAGAIPVDAQRGVRDA